MNNKQNLSNFKNKQRNKSNVSSSIFLACIAVVLLVTCGVYFVQNHNISTINTKTKTENVQAQNKLNSEKDIKPITFKHNYDKKSVNLNKVEAQETPKLSRAISLAYSHSQSAQQFKNNKATIKNLLGSSINSKVTSIIQPEINQNTTKPRSISQKEMSNDISYGEYDPASKTLPIMINIAYHTYNMDPNAGAGASDTGKKYVFNGYTTINADLNVSTGQLSETDFHNHIDTDNPVGNGIKVHKKAHKRSHKHKQIIKKNKKMTHTKKHSRK